VNASGSYVVKLQFTVILTGWDRGDQVIQFMVDWDINHLVFFLHVLLLNAKLGEKMNLVCLKLLFFFCS
jgi:hypothetical protein